MEKESIVTSPKIGLIRDPNQDIQCDSNMFRPRYACMSFVFPEENAKKRMIIEMNQFIYHDINKQILDSGIGLCNDINIKFNNLMQHHIDKYISSKDNNNREVASILGLIKEEMSLDDKTLPNSFIRQYKIDEDELISRFDTFKVDNAKNLQVLVSKNLDKEISTRGFKIRGIHQNYDDAVSYVRVLEQNDIKSKGPTHHIFVNEIYNWTPIDPSSINAINNQIYAGENGNRACELTSLMEKYSENIDKRKKMFDDRADNMTETSKKDMHDKLHANLIEKVNKRQKKQRKQRKSNISVGNTSTDLEDLLKDKTNK
jgi:hypothetical protein